MTDDAARYEKLIEWLQERGHSEDEIDKILAGVRRYDRETEADSVMDSIASGQLDLSAIIEEALAEAQDE